MGWRFWQKGDEVAGPAEEDDWRDVDVVVLDRPASTAPGAPLPCRNDGDPVRVGEPVALSTTFTHQPTTIRAIRVNGVESDVLGSDQLGDVVLGDEVDLGHVYRGSSLVVDEEGDWPEGSLVVQVQRAEQRGEDALVSVRIAFGAARPGLRLVTSHDDDRLPPLLEVVSVEPGAGSEEVELVLRKVPADRFQLGDQLTHVEL